MVSGPRLSLEKAAAPTRRSSGRIQRAIGKFQEGTTTMPFIRRGASVTSAATLTLVLASTSNAGAKGLRKGRLGITLPAAQSLLSVKSLVGIGALLSLILFCEPVRAGAIITLPCNTGFNANCTMELPDGTLDPNYILTVNPQSSPGSVVVNHTPDPITPGPWLADTAVSDWIGPVADQHFGGGCCALGLYIYEQSVTVSGPGTASIGGRWASDNGAEIFVNGTLAAGSGVTIPDTASAFTTWTPFTILDLPPGVDNIMFEVFNDSNATGLRVEYSVPEPSTMALLGAGLVALAFVIRRRRIEVV
jgi:hypothetical protein